MNSSTPSCDRRQRFFDRGAPGWDTLCEDYTQTDLFHNWFVGLDIQPGQRLLEIGCGTGRVLPWLKRAAGPSGEALGLDLSLGMLNESKKKRCDSPAAAEKGNASSLLIQGEARKLPFRDQSFHRIFILNTFPHLEPRETVLSETLRILRRGGTLHIVHFCGREFINRIHAEAGEEVREDRLPGADALGAILERLGFRIFSVEDREDFYQVSGVRR